MEQERGGREGKQIERRRKGAGKKGARERGKKK